MGFLLPEFYQPKNQLLTSPLSHAWRQSGDSAKARCKNLTSIPHDFSLSSLLKTIDSWQQMNKIKKNSHEG